MLQAKINGKWGEVPEGILPELPEEGTVATFEFLYTYPHASTKKPTWKANEQIQSIIKVKNPQNKNQSMEIGLIDGVDLTGNPHSAGIRRIILQPLAGAGFHRITIGNSISGNELYQFMVLSSQNESSPIRDNEVEPVYRLKDYVKEAKESLKKMEAEHEAFATAYALKGAELTSAANILGVDGTQGEHQSRVNVVEWAKKNPGTFNKLMSDPDRPTKAVLAAGLANGTLSISEEAGAIVYTDGGTQVLPLTSTDRDSAMEEFAAFIRTDKNGTKTLGALKSLIDAKGKK